MKITGIILIFLFSINGYSQSANTVSLTECMKSARENNILSTLDNDLGNMKNEIGKQTRINSYPKIDLEALATLQSENISLDLPIPNVPSIELPLYKANIYAKVDYAIYDGGVNKISGKLKELDIDLLEKENEVNLYQLNKSVSSLFFGIKLLRGKRSILEEILKDINDKYNTLKKAEKGGVVVSIDIERLDYEISKLNGEIDKTRFDEEILFSVLNELTDSEYNLKAELVYDLVSIEMDISRPEVELLNAKFNNIGARVDLIDAVKKPKVFSFAQAGFGYPNPINFFDDSFSPYGIVGVKAVWNVYDFRRSNSQKESIRIQQDIIVKQKSAFDQKISLENTRIRSGIQSIKSSIENDLKLLVIQDRIIEKVGNQMKHGTIKPVDYITEINKKTQLELSIELKKIQIKQLETDIRINSGL